MIDDVKCTGHQISVTFHLFIVEWIQMLSFTPKSFPFIKFKKKQEKMFKKRPFFNPDFEDSSFMDNKNKLDSSNTHLECPQQCSCPVRNLIFFFFPQMWRPFHTYPTYWPTDTTPGSTPWRRKMAVKDYIQHWTPSKFKPWCWAVTPAVLHLRKAWVDRHWRTVTPLTPSMSKRQFVI